MQRETRESWHTRPLAALTAQFGTDMQHGLAPQEAAQRLQHDGPKALRTARAVSPLALLASQFGNLVIWVLIGAALVAAALGEVVDGFAILAIVVLNAVIGFVQEYRAERAVAALARLTAPRARVVRSGRADSIATTEVVCGDILLLDAGDLVAADARLVEASALRSTEAPLTGESQPVEKQAGVCPPETPLAERHNMVSVSGEGYSTAGGFVADGAECTAAEAPWLDDLLRAAAACNDAEFHAQHTPPTAIGDPTEIALLVVAAKGGITREAIEVEMPRLGTLPFDSERKRMTVIRHRGGRPWAFVKGAPEVMLERCTSLRTTQEVTALTDSDRARMLQASALLAHEALRVLALAERPLDTLADPEVIEQGLTFLGLVGLQDPPRAEAFEAVQRCKRAGIRTVMITGDHPDTAGAIARELGILEPGEAVMVGRELDQMDAQELTQRVPGISVYARVTAEHKLRIVRAWKAQGAVVAMTGDGVNDAPALKEASIGVAMGVTGTEVTKEAAAIIITDDNFASIVAAVEEGRGIYDNITKTLAYLLSGNVGELALMFVAALLGWPLPLLPIHLLWINLVTDGLPALALATDPIDPGVLTRPPRRPDAQLLDWRFAQRVVGVGCLTAGVALSAFAWEWYRDQNLTHARDAAFSVLVMAELCRAFGARSATRTVWQMGCVSNPQLVVIVLASLALQLALHSLPPLQVLFGTTPVSLGHYGAWLLLGSIPLLALELHKIVRRSSTRRVSR